MFTLLQKSSQDIPTAEVVIQLATTVEMYNEIVHKLE